jgi:predicted heme/steroid binding protein
MTICWQTHLSKNSYKKFHVIDAVRIYKKSIFCLCAPGDLEVRKALFDIIGVGCIPVTFHNSTAGEYVAYVGNVHDVTLSFDFDGTGIVLHQKNLSVGYQAQFRPSLSDSLQNSINVIDYLKSFLINNRKTVEQMQQKIEIVAKATTYNVIDDCDRNLNHGVISNTRRNQHPLSSLHYDASDILLDLLFERAAH